MAKRHEEILRNLVSRYRGEIQNLMGDGSLCLFKTATDAVQCAREIQIILQEERIPVRIGIHDGEVTLEDGKAFGDAINVASRIESSGYAGTIIFSKSIQEKVKSDSSLNSEPLGQFQFKNVANPLELFALKEKDLPDIDLSLLKNRVAGSSFLRKLSYGIIGSLALIAVFVLFIKPGRHSLFGSGISVPRFDEKSISVAVFPFKTSGLEEIEYLGDGIMDLLSTKFSYIEGMTSLDPTIAHSIFIENGRDISKVVKLPIWQDNGFDYLVSGSILKLGNVLKVIGNIVKSDGAALRPVEIENENIDSSDASIVKLSLLMLSKIQEDSKKDFTSIAFNPSYDFEAITQYMMGESARRDGNLFQAHDHFASAVGIDSSFALAWLRI